MGRVYFDEGEQGGRPDPLLVDQEQIRQGLAQAYSAVASDQRDARAFIESHGAQVVGGHPDVRRPGAQGDPDPQLDSAD